MVVRYGVRIIILKELRLDLACLCRGVTSNLRNVSGYLRTKSPSGTANSAKRMVEGVTPA